MAGAETHSALEGQLELESEEVAQIAGCSSNQARAFLLSQPGYYARLCPLPNSLFVSPARKLRVARLRHLLNTRSPRLSAPDDPLLKELEAEVAAVEFAGKAPPLGERTRIRRELLNAGLPSWVLRKAFGSLAVVRSSGLWVRRAPSAVFAAVASLGHQSAAICSLVLLLAAAGQVISTGCIGCSELGLVYVALTLGWFSYCLFLFGPDWVNSDRLLVQLGL